MKYIFVFTLVSLLFPNNLFGQFEEDSLYIEEYYQEDADTNNVEDTFYSTRVINGHSVETLRKGVLEFRIEHRFGDIGGEDGGAQSFYGFDNAADIRFALEYGLTNDLMVGFGRSKGTGAPYKSLLDGFIKYRIFHQEKKGFPFSLSAEATMNCTYMKKTDDLTQFNSFPNFEDRFAYSTQLNFARKFGKRLSLAVMPTIVHRNLVFADDANTLFALGGAMRFSINTKMAILVEYYHCMGDDDIRNDNKNSLGVAFEWITFGHNFTINLTNSKGFGDVQFITCTYEDWLKSQFRLGFCIGRKFESE